AGGENLHLARFEAKIARPRIGVELVTRSENATVVVDDVFLGIFRRLPWPVTIAAGPVARPLYAPLQRSDDAVVVHRGEAVLPVVHPLCVARGHEEPSSLAIARSNSDRNRREWLQLGIRGCNLIGKR